MGKMSDLDLQNKEEIPDYSFEDPWSYYEEGQNAYISGGRNPHKQGSYAWAEWERGWLDENRRECILDDRE